ncbi:nucleotide pyrophosphohydrolase [Facklamia sp. P12934]|uniref:nucleotide pyrophosphohydrolase n=1 Tax=Facklamia sp. P12934 TaxID=3421948 RepID=UPI003D186B5F
MDKLKKEVDDFRDKRDWRQFHNEKDLAISIAIEASELLELFQWNTSEETVKNNLSDLKDELADVLIYSIMLASNLDLNIEEIILNKLEKNDLKYPISKSKGTKKKYTDFDIL